MRVDRCGDCSPKRCCQLDESSRAAGAANVAKTKQNAGPRRLAAWYKKAVRERRTEFMRVVAALLFSMTVSGTSAALAQGEPPASERAATASEDPPDEVIVRGRRIGELRVQVEAARIRAYDIFNDLNGDDDFDVACHEESRSGTRATLV